MPERLKKGTGNAKCRLYDLRSRVRIPVRYEWTEAMLSSHYHEARRIETSLEVKGWSETQLC